MPGSIMIPAVFCIVLIYLLQIGPSSFANTMTDSDITGTASWIPAILLSAIQPEQKQESYWNQILLSDML